MPHVEELLPPTTEVSPVSSGFGAKTLVAWIGGAAATGLLVSVLGALFLLPDDEGSRGDLVVAKSEGVQPIGSVSANASASAKVEQTSASVSSLPSLVERAEQGDPNAIEQIDRRPDSKRTVRETLAWARGRSARKHQRLEALEKKLRSDLPLSADRETLGKLRPFTKDSETSTEALAIIASLETPMAADLLYDVWVGTRGKTEATELAQRLLSTKQVRDSASEALAVALDLRAATSCEQVAEILPRAKEHGDKRSLMLLGKLNYRYGCGRRGGQDCYPCLRGSSAINDAIAAVRRRPAPGI